MGICRDEIQKINAAFCCARPSFNCRPSCREKMERKQAHTEKGQTKPEKKLSLIDCHLYQTCYFIPVYQLRAAAGRKHNHYYCQLERKICVKLLHLDLGFFRGLFRYGIGKASKKKLGSRKLWKYGFASDKIKGALSDYPRFLFTVCVCVIAPGRVLFKGKRGTLFVRVAIRGNNSL